VTPWTLLHATLLPYATIVNVSREASGTYVRSCYMSCEFDDLWTLLAYLTRLWLFSQLVHATGLQRFHLTMTLFGQASSVQRRKQWSILFSSCLTKFLLNCKIGEIMTKLERWRWRAVPRERPCCYLQLQNPSIERWTCAVASWSGPSTSADRLHQIRSPELHLSHNICNKIQMVGSNTSLILNWNPY